MALEIVGSNPIAHPTAPHREAGPTLIQAPSSSHLESSDFYNLMV